MSEQIVAVCGPTAGCGHRWRVGVEAGIACEPSSDRDPAEKGRVRGPESPLGDALRGIAELRRQPEDDGSITVVIKS